MFTHEKGNGMAESHKIWSNAVNTLLNAMESILLDEDLQSLWPREHNTQDYKKKHMLPQTPTTFSPHDPTFSPPLKRKKDPLPPSDRNTKTQRMTDHLTNRLAASLHISSSTDTQNPVHLNQTGLENSRGFYRVQQADSPTAAQSGNGDGYQDLAGSIASSEPRKYRKAARNRSNPTTPIHSHPPSPGTQSHLVGDDLLSAFSSSPINASHLGHELSFDSFARNTTSSTIFLDPQRSTRPSSLLLRREGRMDQNHLRSPSHHHLAMATRLALFHRIHSTTKAAAAQSKDMEAWIAEQIPKRGFQDRQSFEATMTSRNQILVAALAALGDGFSRKLQQSLTPIQDQSQVQVQEIAIYNNIQSAVDAILASAQWLCGPEFEMGINRICPQWSAYESSIEQIVHYVQVIESMRETLSGRFRHPQDLSEDLTRSQEVIDYQRTLFGEALRNQGLEWRALGLPAMEDLIQSTQDWILNLANRLTFKIMGEVSLALESASFFRSIANPLDMDMVEDEDTSIMGHSVSGAMGLVLQGALLSGSCLELAGKRCPMLLTAWMDLTTRYCIYTLAKQKKQLLKARKSLPNQIGKSTTPGNVLSMAYLRKQQQHHLHPGFSRGVFLKTMELFEDVSRLLQCVMEMREEEEHDEQGRGTCGDGLGGQSEYDEYGAFQGTSAASSDQDEAMDFVPTSSSTAFQQQRPPRANFHNQRRTPVDQTLRQRWIAMESLASVLVEIGLELCGSMAEILGCGYHTTESSSANSPTPSTQASLDGFGRNSFLASHPTSSSSFGVATHPVGSTPNMSSSARAAAAISSLTMFAGGGAMASGTGGVGLIYVQFVVRLLSKIIDFAGQDPHQEQRLLRVHASLQNLEFALSAS
ncbi:hypothetical protein EDD21DRAFT_181393 [Dissophora ornata]|nr:hypothetical protein EDD21DRAFT_181393 [Dissophora ornata]